MGLYDTITFKFYLRYSYDDTLPLSLFMPIKKAQTWKFTNSASGSWTEVSFSDSSWADYVEGGSTSSTGTQYYRKTFTAVADNAAYEIGVKYRHGILVHVNGVELLRDNMATGDVDSSTTAEGLYTDSIFRRFIRNGHELASSSVLAVEIHFLTTTHTGIDFDGYLATYAATTNTNLNPSK